jgi:glycosyltransferase involved in cell wall biosynthesis
VQTRPLASLDEVVVVHDGLAPAARERLQEAAGRRLRFVALDDGADYYAAKDAGFAATRADVVAFADADCWPDPDWLRALLEPFADGDDVVAVAGRTSYRDDLFGAAATAVDFMYFASPLGPGCTRNFYANNVAFRREVLARAGFGAHGFYRGSCQVLGLALQASGIPIRLAARAHTVHRLPDTAADLVRLRLLRGADSVELAPHLARAYLPRRARWLARLGPLSGLAVLAVRFGCSLLALRRQRCHAARGPRWIAGAAIVAAIHAVDAAGAVIRGLRIGLAPPDRHARALRYHRDVDRLAA